MKEDFDEVVNLDGFILFILFKIGSVDESGGLIEEFIVVG